MSTVGNWRGANIIKQGLVLYLDPGSPNSYYNKTNTNIKDISGNGYDGTLTNFGSQTIYDSGSGGSIVFDGNNDYINLGSSSTINYLSGDFAIDCWVYYNGTHSEIGGNIIGNYYTGGVGSAGDWQLMVIKTNNTIVFYSTTGGNLITNISITRNVWTNVVLSRVSGVMKMYTNGTERISINNTTNFTRVGGNLNIGIDGNNAAEPFGGYISTIRMYNNKGLPAAEVLQNFNATKARFSDFWNDGFVWDDNMGWIDNY